jgi:hypothetical protein
MDFQQILMAAATQGGGAAAAPPPSDQFPDPTLADTGNAALWQFDNSAGMVPANAGAGPDIAVNNADLSNDDNCELADGGAHCTALLAAWAASTSKTVHITAGSFTSPGSVFVKSRSGSFVEFAFSGAGTVSHSVVSGTELNQPFKIGAPDGADGGVFTITAISIP